MSTVRDLHRTAMDLAEAAVEAKTLGDANVASNLLRQAMEHEIRAATAVAPRLDAEPSRSILLRSAASLALECKEYREAERLIATALVGTPPEEIADELRDLLEQVHFSRHLALRKIELSSAQMQLSLAGPMVGYGLTSSDVFVSRVQDMHRVLVRSSERKLGQPFRDHSAAPYVMSDRFPLYLEAVRPGSFTVTLRLGKPEQPEIPGLESAFPHELLSDVMTNLDLVNRGQEDEVQRRIVDPAYFRNFIGLARRLAPDGTDVSLVGLTTVEAGAERHVEFVRRKETIVPVPLTGEDRQLAGRIVTIEGFLRFADSTRGEKGIIKLVDDTGQKHKVKVPEGMMGDIVRPLYEDRVIVAGTEINGVLHLQNIEKANENPDQIKG